jgi:hypothetical protein
MASTGATAGGAQETDEDLNFAQVRYVKARQSGDGSWRFDVTVRHLDEGWEHYCDLWRVVDPETGAVIGERVLLHPHDTEQPFTRSQSGIVTELDKVLVEAKCNVHGFGGHAVLVDLTGGTKSEEYEVRPR